MLSNRALTSHDSICSGQKIEAECMTINPRGFLSWKINDIKHEFHPEDSNFQVSPTDNILLALTYTTSLMGGIMYTSTATVLNVHNQTTIICSDGVMMKKFVYNLKSMPINCLLHLLQFAQCYCIYTGSPRIDFVSTFYHNQVQLSWKEANCCKGYIINVAGKIRKPTRPFIHWHVNSSDQVMFEPVTMHCLDHAEKEVLVSHTMLRITGEKFNVCMHALYIIINLCLQNAIILSFYRVEISISSYHTCCENFIKC